MSATRRDPGLLLATLVGALCACASPAPAPGSPAPAPGSPSPASRSAAPAGDAADVRDFDFCAGADATARPDTDRDGLIDACESGLAAAFAPVLMQDPGDCVWREAPESARIPGGYHYAVHRAGEARILIAYLPGYLRDCGWTGGKCLLPGVDCRPHAGDSEAIILEIVFDTTRSAWSPTALFLSAHCFDGRASSCRWYEPAELSMFEWQGPAPVVWVASGRHANYASASACERGHYGLDTCPREPIPARFPLLAGHNVGAAAAPVGEDGCAEPPAHIPPRLVAPGAVECFWNDRPFRGWQDPAHRGVTPYRRYLQLIESR